MKRNFYILVILCIMLTAVVSCSKSGNGPDGSNNGGSTPYFEYSIGGDKAIRVNCAEINFSARDGETISGVFATSASNKSTFSFTFPATSAAIEAAGTGDYPVLPFKGYLDGSEPFEFSLRAPKTAGGTDYYMATEPTAADHKNTVKKIEKGSVESGKQVYWVEGEYKLPAKNADEQTTTITGKYRFKLYTLLTAAQ
ncbi:hypothetical protein DJ568_06775 [Mucilaginibacter hurinus]|uniref:Lipocalin-like domain-containing protein n=1 Tax=Mucilaginibacter hurinus TaxID=2201324 RepID=A0A367GQR3_9SPHI|nr:hypothetical protein [Mucilaginibacter hurinus]RCH55590.1 hypothetical protein DJ568_06775 [Mucilaginibacter hurinus]